MAGRPPPERPAKSYWTDRTERGQDMLGKWLEICQDRRNLLFPLANHFITLFFIILSELSDGQRERLTSLPQSKGILVHW